MIILIALLALLVGAPLFGQCTGIFVPANFGGRAGAAVGYADSTVPTTFIDLTRPATARASVSEIDFRATTTAATPLKVRFVAFRPSGTNYIARNVSDTLSFTPTELAQSQVFVARLTPPLQFEPGDLLGATVSAGSGGGLTIISPVERSGYLVFHADAPAGTQFGRDAAFATVQNYVLAMEAVFSAPCEQLPPPALLVPVVGDVVGAAHFTTDFITYFAPSGSGGPMPIQLTLHDRMGGSPRIATATVNGSIGFPYHPASLTTVLNVTPPYFGPLIVAFPGTGGFQTPAMSASARVTAATATCSGGETGSAVEAVSCSGIGRELAIPFHVPSNHRLNIGIASAQLNSCGIFSPATSAEVWINGGPHVIVPMPGESTQIGDITGAGGGPYGSSGVTDGVVYIRVTDEASRIAAYSSLLDNTSQDSSIALGSVVQ